MLVWGLALEFESLLALVWQMPMHLVLPMQLALHSHLQLP
jgi:hypothetical protein